MNTHIAYDYNPTMNHQWHLGNERAAVWSAVQTAAGNNALLSAAHEKYRP